MRTDPKRDAQYTEDAGLTGLPLEAPSTATPSIEIPSTATPPQGPMRAPTPSRQDRLDLERSAGEGMTSTPVTKP